LFIEVLGGIIVIFDQFIPMGQDKRDFLAMATSLGMRVKWKGIQIIQAIILSATIFARPLLAVKI